MKAFLSAALLLATAGCADTVWPPQFVWTPSWGSHPGQLTLSNDRFIEASVQAVMATGPDCAPADPSAPSTAFDLPFKGSRVIEAAPSADVCWRRQLANGQWTDWSRALTASGRYVDARL
ncbi:MAG TPA: hypothetical protein VNV38_08845 [Stellaceae bacterium]|nr:hypothetical protein [Stellaceae bacterium]